MWDVAVCLNMYTCVRHEYGWKLLTYSMIILSSFCNGVGVGGVMDGIMVVCGGEGRHNIHANYGMVLH